MKTIVISIILIVSSLATYSQFAITYKTHALEPDYSHITQKIEGVSEGNSGPNQIWNFSNLICNQTSINTLIESVESKSYNSFSESNVCIQDQTSDFFFKITQEGNYYLGLVTPHSVIHFDQSIPKMLYPFAFGNKFSGEFTGNGTYYEQIHSQIFGNYEVEADAYGTLILPNNVTIQNVLRIKTTEYFNETTCNTTEFFNTKYLWYCENFRYPIMVVTVSRKLVDGIETLSRYGYYNEMAVSSFEQKSIADNLNFSLKLYPNPFSEFLTFTYDLPKPEKVSISLYNFAGSRIHDFVNNQIQEGLHNYTLNSTEMNLAVGAYFIRFYFGDQIVFRKIILLE